MKKILKNPLGLVLICNLAFFISCNKNKAITPPADPEPVTTDITNGLPDDPRKINGYFYAGNAVNIYSGNNSIGVYEYAVFGDPSRNLMANYNHLTNTSRFSGNQNDVGNVSDGDLFFNGMMIGSAGNTNYMQSNSYGGSSNSSAHWVSSGNLSFKPIDLTVPRGFPTIIQPAYTTYSLNRGADLTINFSNFISNYDSICVALSDYGSTGAQYKIRKAISSGVNSITISQTELSVLSTTSYGNITFAAFNYSNKIIEDKIYVFELSNRINMTLVISQ